MSKTQANDIEALAERLTSWVNDALRDGAAPSDVAYTLAAMATDMGLEVAKDPYRVLPVVLTAIRDQIGRRAKAANDNEPAAEPDWHELAERSTIH